MENGSGKIKVLQVSCNGLGNGGVQSVIMNIVRALKNEIEFDILLFTDEIRHYDNEFEQYGNIFRIPNYDGNSKFRKRIDYYIRFRRIMTGTMKILHEYGPYNAIHCHNFFESAICILAAKKTNVPVRIAHSHSVKSTASKWKINEIYNFLLRIIIKINSNVKVGCSKPASHFLFGNNRSAIVINNPIDLKKFNIENFDIEKKEKIRFIHVGKFYEVKNQLFLLDVFKYIHFTLNNSELILIGSGEDEAKIKKKIDDCQLNDSLRILPHDTDVPGVLASSDFMIFPSKFEGLPIALIEAQAMGVVCFASNRVPPEVNQGLCMFYDLSEGAETWADKIIDYIDKNGTSKKTVNMESFNIDIVCKQYAAIYSGRRLEG